MPISQIVSNSLGSALTFTGQQTIPTINLTGGQIRFPATQVESTNANTLDDYEEGTFTPFFSFGGSTSGQTYSTQAGFYVKIGRQVWIWGTIRITSVGSTSGVGSLTGLPFSPSIGTEGNLGGDGYVSTGPAMKLIIDPGTIWLAYQTGSAGGSSSWANLSQGNVTDGGKYFAASYYVSA